MFTSFDFDFVDQHIQIDDNTFIRVFTDEIDDQHFDWHRDKKDRYVKILYVNSGWLFQFDNQLPFELQAYQEFFIRKEEYHKLHKGKEKLILIVKEVSSVDIKQDHEKT
jgi:hypothetical protein